MPYYRVTFPLTDREQIRLPAMTISQHSARVCAATWERALLLAAADAPPPLAPAIYNCLVREGARVERCD